MASISPAEAYKLTFFTLVSISVVSVHVSSYQFLVGGHRGWVKPTPKNTGFYNEWAGETRFHVGDSLGFQYLNDSVLVVNSTAYKNCVLSNPISKFSDGNTTFVFDRYGFFYFISGEPGHCKAGQKIIIRVMVQSEIMVPQLAPSPQDGYDDSDGWDSFNWGPPSINSTVKLSVASYILSALGGIMVIFYLFMQN